MVMRIGELAAQAGVDVQTIRYYEKAGLMAEPHRTESGYRQYRPEQLDTLQFIRHCRSLDMSLAEVRTLLDFRDHPDRTCTDVDQLIARHIEQLHQRIAQMQQLEQQLKVLQQRCGEQRTAAECGILQSLTTAASDCSCHGAFEADCQASP
ncbi:Cd(II)/Pb(II)-responsive transcriptional regulator [Permianibacter sp. IMCC34836]|nr:Cd(II)/Pb(II)-responsive transcriptional regulator [Permianibacter fluminis]